MQQKSELPEGWAECEVGDIADVCGGKRLPKGHKYSQEKTNYPYLRVEDFRNQSINENSLKYIDSKTRALISNYTISKNDVYISIAGSIGKVGEIPDQLDGANLTENAAKICNFYHLNKKYLLFLFNSELCQNQMQNKMISTNQPKLALYKIKEISILLPPLSEQHRIVLAIEALFARLDATNEKLDSVLGILRKFRESVLVAACEGRLTEEWRKNNPEIEPISSIISYIQYSEKNLKSRANYKVKKIDVLKLPNLPSKWEWHSIISVSNRVTVGHVGPMKDEYVEEGIPFLRSQNVRENRYDSSGLKYISLEFHNKIKKSALEPNDLVVVRSGNVGVSCVIPDYLKEANCSDLVVVKQPFGFVSEYGSYYLNSIAKSTIELNKVGIALSHFNTQSVANLPIPLPPLPEQKEIVRRVDALFAFADSIEAKVATAREKTEKLRQSILAKAFSGQLVETEAEIAKREGRDYETAEVLLGRIKEEREKGGKKQ